MGTNYYARRKSEPACDHCGHQVTYPELHIGKSSGGWCFLLRVYPEDEYSSEDERGLPKSLEDWKVYWAQEGVTIRDEYGHEKTVEEMLHTITQRAGKHDFDGPPPVNVTHSRSALSVSTPQGWAGNTNIRYRHWQHYFDAVHGRRALPGPKGLLRHKLADLSPYGCIAHGEGTWDLHAGEFS